MNNSTVNATVVGFQTTSGAAIKMNPSSEMRFESKIDKETYDYLVAKYGSSNIKTGTYIVSKALLGLETIDSYFENHYQRTTCCSQKENFFMKIKLYIYHKDMLFLKTFKYL